MTDATIKAACPRCGETFIVTHDVCDPDGEHTPTGLLYMLDVCDPCDKDMGIYHRQLGAKPAGKVLDIHRGA